MLEIFSIDNYQLSELGCQLVWLGARIDIFFVRGLGVETAVYLKRCITGAGIFRIIVSKFRYRKKLGLIVLFVIDKSSEISFHCTVLSLSLAISLKVESNGEPLLNCKEVI